jgi:ABC-type polar amino acid transport system ATPase subunit
MLGPEDVYTRLRQIAELARKAPKMVLTTLAHHIDIALLVALQALWDGAMQMRGGWLVEVDIKSFFDTLDQARLRKFLDQRVRDGVIRHACRPTSSAQRTRDPTSRMR